MADIQHAACLTDLVKWDGSLRFFQVVLTSRLGIAICKCVYLLILENLCVYKMDKRVSLKSQ